MQRTTLILGAGASAASRFQLPTMSTFFRDATGDPLLDRFVERFTGPDGARSANLEEVLGFLELSRVRRELWGLAPSTDHEPSKLYDLLLKFVKRRLSIPPAETCELHKSLVSQLAPRDSIVSLNYDLVLDQTLHEVEAKNEHGRLDQNSRLGKLGRLIGDGSFMAGSPPALVPAELERGFYLKLHGSLDWLYCPTVGCPNNIHLYPLLVERITEGQTEGRPCRLCGGPLRFLIVPPVATKRLEDRGRIAFLWNLALREIAEASRVVVIGASFAASDFELRWLFREAARLRPRDLAELAIVNPSQEHQKEIRRVLEAPSTSVVPFESVEAYLAGV
jgi:hypothetical protein